MDGIVNIYKERGFTSHDVVAKLRGILHMKKIGHTGTLDPEATGVLPVCLGKATKLCDLLADRTKTYQAVLRLGVSTDTEDMTGKVLKEREVTVSEDEVRSAVLSFSGSYEQIPPMYSARKVNGKKLYELARAGQVVERKAHAVEITELVIDAIELPLVTFTVTCSKGTYIRSLCRDIGERLGCLGAMQDLVRTRVGSFLIEDAITLEQVEQLVEQGNIKENIVPVDNAFATLPAIVVPSGFDRLVDNGNSFRWEQPCADGANVRVYKCNRTFIGIYQYDAAGRCMKPVKLFFVEMG